MTRVIICGLLTTSTHRACHPGIAELLDLQAVSSVHALKFDHIRVTQLHVQADTRSGALMMSTGWFSPTKQAAQTALSPGKPVLYSTGKQPLSPCKSGISHQSVSPLSVKRCLSGSQTQYSVGASLQSRQAGDSSQVYRRNDECIFSRDASTTAPSSESSQINPALAPSACLTAPASTSSTVPQTLRQEQHEPWLALSSASQRSSMVPGTADLQASNGSTFWQGPSTSVGTATSAASALADQIPSARDVLESPPEVERDDSCSREQQAGQTFQGSLRPLMSGRRVTRRFDVPLGLDWLTRVPDHVANLGSGRLDIIMGPMFAGKTTQLIKRVQEVSKDGQIAVVVKSSKDARYGCHWVVTHDGRCMRCFTADTLQQFKEIMGPHYQKLQVLAIDEAQFFPDLSEFCLNAVDHEGKHVIVAGLSGDSNRQKFGQLLDLMPLADDVMKLTSKCAFCDQDALFSVRLVGSGPQALVGGDDKYRAACRRCYLTHSTSGIAPLGQ